MAQVQGSAPSPGTLETMLLAAGSGSGSRLGPGALATHDSRLTTHDSIMHVTSSSMGSLEAQGELQRRLWGVPSASSGLRGGGWAPGTQGQGCWGACGSGAAALPGAESQPQLQLHARRPGNS